jgi:hypothetical protein
MRNTTFAQSEDVKSYIIELLDQGDDCNLIFNLGGRFPTLTIHEFTDIMMDLYDDGIEIPGFVY